ncbi:hypothetical protein CSUI_004335, partial [Cystoisospora suis]
MLGTSTRDGSVCLWKVPEKTEPYSQALGLLCNLSDYYLDVLKRKRRERDPSFFSHDDSTSEEEQKEERDHSPPWGVCTPQKEEDHRHDALMETTNKPRRGQEDLGVEGQEQISTNEKEKEEEKEKRREMNKKKMKRSGELDPCRGECTSSSSSSFSWRDKIDRDNFDRIFTWRDAIIAFSSNSVTLPLFKVLSNPKKPHATSYPHTNTSLCSPSLSSFSSPARICRDEKNLVETEESAGHAEKKEKFVSLSGQGVYTPHSQLFATVLVGCICAVAGPYSVSLFWLSNKATSSSSSSFSSSLSSSSSSLSPEREGSESRSTTPSRDLSRTRKASVEEEEEGKKDERQQGKKKPKKNLSLRRGRGRKMINRGKRLLSEEGEEETGKVENERLREEGEGEKEDRNGEREEDARHESLKEGENGGSQDEKKEETLREKRKKKFGGAEYLEMSNLNDLQTDKDALHSSESSSASRLTIEAPLSSRPIRGCRLIGSRLKASLKELETTDTEEEEEVEDGEETSLNEEEEVDPRKRKRKKSSLHARYKGDLDDEETPERPRPARRKNAVDISRGKEKEISSRGEDKADPRDDRKHPFPASSPAIESHGNAGPVSKGKRKEIRKRRKGESEDDDGDDDLFNPEEDASSASPPESSSSSFDEEEQDEESEDFTEEEEDSDEEKRKRKRSKGSNKKTRGDKNSQRGSSSKTDLPKKGMNDKGENCLPLPLSSSSIKPTSASSLEKPVMLVLPAQYEEIERRKGGGDKAPDEEEEREEERKNALRNRVIYPLLLRVLPLSSFLSPKEKERKMKRRNGLTDRHIVSDLALSPIHVKIKRKEERRRRGGGKGEEKEKKLQEEKKKRTKLLSRGDRQSSETSADRAVRRERCLPNGEKKIDKKDTRSHEKRDEGEAEKKMKKKKEEEGIGGGSERRGEEEEQERVKEEEEERDEDCDQEEEIVFHLEFHLLIGLCSGGVWRSSCTLVLSPSFFSSSSSSGIATQRVLPSLHLEPDLGQDLSPRRDREMEVSLSSQRHAFDLSHDTARVKMRILSCRITPLQCLFESIGIPAVHLHIQPFYPFLLPSSAERRTCTSLRVNRMKKKSSPEISP